VSFNGGTTPISKTGSYLVAMNNFMVDGGDNYTVFRSCTQPLGGEVDLDAFARYLDEPLACGAAPLEPNQEGPIGGA
jgi:5'-nucleotidase